MNKRPLIIVLALLLTAALAGCATTAPQATQAPGSATPAAATQAAANATAKSEAPVDIEIFEGIGVNLPVADQDPLLKELQQKLGINLTMNTTLGGDDYRNQLNVRIAGGNIPDVMWMISRPDLAKNATDGTILELTPYLDKLNAVASYLGEDNMKAGYIGDKMYAIAKAPNIPYATYFIRKDWLDNLGLGVPTTLDEFVSVVKKFATDDPDKNGAADTLGLTSANGPWSAFQAVFGGYGIGTPNTLYAKDGKLINSLFEPDMPTALTKVKEIIDQGGVDPELFTITDANKFVDKAFQGKVGITYDGWPNYAKGVKTIEQVNPNAEWIQIACPKGPKGSYDVSHPYYTSGLLSFSADLKDNAVKLDKIIDLFNYVVSPEGLRLVCYGVAGDHYNLEGEKIVATPKLASEGGYFWAYQFVGRTEMEYLATKFVGWDQQIKFAKDQPRLKTLDPFMMVPEGFNTTDVNRYISDELIKFVYGRRPLSEYDAFLKELEDNFKYSTYLDSCSEQAKSLGFTD